MMRMYKFYLISLNNTDEEDTIPQENTWLTFLQNTQLLTLSVHYTMVHVKQLI